MYAPGPPPTHTRSCVPPLHSLVAVCVCAMPAQDTHHVPAATAAPVPEAQPENQPRTVLPSPTTTPGLGPAPVRLGPAPTPRRHGPGRRRTTTTLRPFSVAPADTARDFVPWSATTDNGPSTHSSPPSGTASMTGGPASTSASPFSSSVPSAEAGSATSMGTPLQPPGSPSSPAGEVDSPQLNVVVDLARQSIGAGAGGAPPSRGAGASQGASPVSSSPVSSCSVGGGGGGGAGTGSAPHSGGLGVPVRRRLLQRPMSGSPSAGGSGRSLPGSPASTLQTAGGGAGSGTLLPCVRRMGRSSYCRCQGRAKCGRVRSRSLCVPACSWLHTCCLLAPPPPSSLPLLLCRPRKQPALWT
jgi:hypothetical protein